MEKDKRRARQDPAAATSDEPTVPRRFVVRALDALEVGDQREAAEILLSALEDGPRTVRCTCPVCGLGFEWPGLLDHHLRFAHWQADAA